MYNTKIKSLCLNSVLKNTSEIKDYVGILERRFHIYLKKNMKGNYIVNEMVAYFVAYKVGKKQDRLKKYSTICYKVLNGFLEDDEKIKIPDFENIGKGKYDREPMD